MGGAERYLVHRSLIFFTDLGFGMDQTYDLMIILPKYFQCKATPGHGHSYKMLLHTATFLLKTISAPLILEAQFMVCQVHSLQHAQLKAQGLLCPALTKIFWICMDSCK